MMSKHKMQWIALASIFLVGCAATRQYPAPPIMPATRLVESGQTTTITSWQHGSRAFGTGLSNPFSVKRHLAEAVTWFPC
jgi:hypothetical protein